MLRDHPLPRVIRASIKTKPAVSRQDGTRVVRAIKYIVYIYVCIYIYIYIYIDIYIYIRGMIRGEGGVRGKFMRGGADRLPASVFPRAPAPAPLKNRFSVQIRGIRLTLPRARQRGVLSYLTDTSRPILYLLLVGLSRSRDGSQSRERGNTDEGGRLLALAEKYVFPRKPHFHDSGARSRYVTITFERCNLNNAAGALAYAAGVFPSAGNAESRGGSGVRANTPSRAPPDG